MLPNGRRGFLRLFAAGGAGFLVWLGRARAAFAQAVKGAAEPKWTDATIRALADETGVSLAWDSASRASASEDFGHLVRGSARAIAYPRGAAELEKVVAFAGEKGLPLTARGVGHSVGGQSVSAGGVTLDLSRMDRVGKPDPAAQTVVCEPGARWRAVVDAAAPHGLIPPVMPLNLDLTVGGTLSVGGIGGTSYRHGLALSHVAKLEVVTGEGRRIECGADQERALYDATLGGLGRCGTIVSATLALRKTRPLVRTFYLLYDDIAAWVTDQRALATSGRGDYMEGFCAATVQGLRNEGAARRPFVHWFYGLHLSFEHERGQAPEAATALAGLHHYRLLHTEDEQTTRFAARYDPRFEAMARTGAAQQAHPFLECFLPVDALVALLPRVLQTLPVGVADGSRVMFLAPTPLPPFVVVPPGPEVACFAALPAGVAAGAVDDTLKAVRAAHQMLMEAGGKRYLPGWLAMMDAAAWRAHYGERYGEWIEAKRRFDPRGVFSSTLFPADQTSRAGIGGR